MTFFFLKETHPDPMPIRELLGISDSDSKEGLAEEDVKPKKDHSLKATLTKRVAIAAANYACLSLIDIALRAVQPVFLSTPIALGGLGLRPAQIGNILSVFGILNGICQVFFFARIHDRWGSKKLFLAGIFMAIPTFLCFPLMSILAQAQGLSLTVWCVVYLQVVLSIGISFSYGESFRRANRPRSLYSLALYYSGAVFIFITAAAPNRESLGATNGLCQVCIPVFIYQPPATQHSAHR